MLHSQRVMTNFGRKPRIHSGVDVIRHSVVSLERYIPPTLYRRLFIKRIARHPLAIEGFEFRPVQSLFELEEALRLVNDSYARRGISTVCRAGMRFSAFHLLPGTTTFVAIKDQQIVGTVSLIEDSMLGLPLEEVHGNEVVMQRLAGGRLAEVGTLAVAAGYRGKGVPLMLYNAMFRWAMHFRGVQRLLIAVHPRAGAFYRNVLFFSPMGRVQPYTKLNNALSLPLCLDLGNAPAIFQQAYQRPALGFAVEGQRTHFFDFFCRSDYAHIRLPATGSVRRWDAQEVLTHMARCGVHGRNLSPRVQRALALA
ncbi:MULTISPECIES: GNAT family N-acetyltransferase [Pseudomonas]|uniref:GNAT family N-acetyltransferase n=1 Tax=Pseudomonas hygromyciniae TaxID=2812000 RepID=A0ABX7JR63_9PSED|nr:MULTISPECIES: GNAT family N-acetyltransferase [Pseudomonas]MBN0975849.1 GNAT family N-acetyltransferase [Pseudomonas hygromyciniae]NMX90865.1 GNAT family N-acetyltransferase [Pseudomonas sp. WS 5086]NMY45531.1 GNAT family N-acetyltransferase [Pseudomonas sp. WS 5027]QSB37590.1 GNAT family N-acetyltransferase [Pseudomonas hygromyciniae]